MKTTVLAGADYKYVKIQDESRDPYITVQLVSWHWNSKPEYDWNIQFPTPPSNGNPPYHQTDHLVVLNDVVDLFC